MTPRPVPMLLASGSDGGFIPFVNNREVEVWIFVAGAGAGGGVGGDDGEAVEIGCAGVGHVELGGWKGGVRMGG